MNILLAGALVGTAVALMLFAADYFTLRARAAERTKGRRRKPALNGTERRRIASIARFCVFVPPAFAGIFWLLWG